MLIGKYGDYSFNTCIQSHASTLSNIFKLTGNFELTLDFISIKVKEISLTLKFQEKPKMLCLISLWLKYSKTPTKQRKNNTFLCRTNTKHFKSVSVCISSHKHAALHQILGSFCPYFPLWGKKNGAVDWAIYFIIEGGS